MGGCLIKPTGRVTYEIRTVDGKTWIRYVDQLRPRKEATKESSDTIDVEFESEFTEGTDQEQPPGEEKIEERQTEEASDPEKEIRKSSWIKSVPQCYGEYRTHHLEGEEMLYTD